MQPAGFQHLHRVNLTGVRNRKGLMKERFPERKKLPLWINTFVKRYFPELDDNGYLKTEYGISANNSVSEYTSASRYAGIVFEPEARSWRFAKQMFREEFGFLDASPIMDMETAVNWLPKQSAPGYPWSLVSGTKGEVLRNEDFRVWYPYWEHDMFYERGRPTFSRIFIKREIVKWVKLLAHMPRTVMATPLEMTLFGYRLFGVMNSKLNINHDISSSLTWIGGHKYYRKWNKLALRMLKFPHIFEGDIHKFDSTVAASTLWTIMQLRSEFLTADYRKGCENFYKNIIYSFVVLRLGDVFQKDKGQISGQPNTLVDNSFIHVLYLFYVWCNYTCAQSSGNLERTLSSFKQNVELIVMGDDFLMSVSDIAYPYFNDSIISKIMSGLGVSYTISETKLDEASFCGHTFAKEDGLWVPVLPTDRLHAALFLKSDDEPIKKTLLRALSLRIEGWYNHTFRATCETYILYIQTEFDAALRKPPTMRGEDIYTYGQVLTVKKSVAWIKNLYLGLESPVNVADSISSSSSTATRREIMTLYEHYQGARSQFKALNDDYTGRPNFDVPSTAGSLVGITRPSTRVQDFAGRAMGEILAPALGGVNYLTGASIYRDVPKLKYRSRSSAANHVNEREINRRLKSRTLMFRGRGRGGRRAKMAQRPAKKRLPAKTRRLIAIANREKLIASRGKLPSGMRKKAIKQNTKDKGMAFGGTRTVIPTTVGYGGTTGMNVSGKMRSGGNVMELPFRVWDDTLSAFYEAKDSTYNFIVQGSSTTNCCSEYVCAPWNDFYNPNLLKDIGKGYGKWRLKRFRLSFKPTLTYNNGGEILFASIDNIAEVQNRGLTFVTPSPSARIAAGHEIVISDIYGGASTYWGTGFDLSYKVKQWTGAKVYQKAPYLPHVQELQPSKGWRRNCPPAGFVNSDQQVYYDTVDTADALTTTAGMMMIWGHMSDDYKSPAANTFRKVGDLYLDAIYEFKDLGWEMSDFDIKLSAKSLQKQIEELSLEVKSLRNPPLPKGNIPNPIGDKRESKDEYVDLEEEQFERPPTTPIPDVNDPGRISMFGFGYGAQKKSSSNKSTRSNTSKQEKS